MPTSHTPEVVIVTGGGRGIGAATARLAAARGYSVCVNYRDNLASARRVVDATFTRGLAAEVATEGIRVNAVRAGFIDTEMHASGGEPGRVDRVKAFVPMRRGGDADEVAQAVLWLLSDQASCTTGSFIDVSGGR